MDTIPQDVWPKIASYVDLKGKRQLRLASITWFNIIKYGDFKIYFAEDKALPAISERLSKYSWPIKLTFEKHKLKSVRNIINNVKNITNMIEFSADEPLNDFSDINNLEDSDWLNLSTLTNIEQWNFLLSDIPATLWMHFTKLKS